MFYEKFKDKHIETDWAWQIQRIKEPMIIQGEKNKDKIIYICKKDMLQTFALTLNGQDNGVSAKEKTM